MNIKDKTAVLIHGLHLEAGNWNKIVWGDPLNGDWGTIPRGIEAAWESQANFIFWGTGASKKDGLKESEYTYKYALEHIDDLAKICECPPEELKTFLNDRSYIDTETQNTRQEVPTFLDKCLDKDIFNVKLIAVASHAPRSIRTVLSCITSNDKYAVFRHTISILPSSTLFDDTTMEDVVIFEKPHRGDRPKNNNHILARRAMDILKTDRQDVFLKEWEDLIQKYEEN